MKVGTQHESLARIARTSRPEDIDRCLQPVLEPKQIRFGNVEFREYTRRLSDNPSTSSGAPIGIGWNFNPEDTISIELEVYEDDREGSRRTKRELAIPAGKFDVVDEDEVVIFPMIQFCVIWNCNWLANDTILLI